jgi:hypothetical protein
MRPESTVIRPRFNANKGSRRKRLRRLSGLRLRQGVTRQEHPDDDGDNHR